MSLWLYMNGAIRGMEEKADVGAKMCANDRKWLLNTILFADNTALIAENENDLQNLVNVFQSVNKWQKLKVNVDKNKEMVSESV